MYNRFRVFRGQMIRVISMIENGHNPTPKDRIYFIDHLRTFMIFLVVVYHCGLVYENSGIAGFFWIVHDPATTALASIPNLMILDIFIMSTIFFISGFLTPLSLKRKTGWSFLKSKFKRLMIPWLIAVLTLMPLYKFIFLASRNLPQEHWSGYFHWSNGIFSQNWLWFLPVLFLFDVLYVLLASLKIKLPNINLKGAVGIVFVLGFVYSFLMDVLNLEGWTKTALLDFQNERLLIYWMIFLLGSLCCRLRIFEFEAKSNTFFLTILGTVWIPLVLYYILYRNSFLKPGSFVFSAAIDTVLTWLSFHLALLGLLYLLLMCFKHYLNQPGNISGELNQNSYNVYIIHTIVLGAVASTMLGAAIPAVLKLLILIAATYIASNLLVYVYRKVVKAKMLILMMK